MKNLFSRNSISRHKSLIAGSLGSAFLLSAFLIFQHYESPVLELESRWLMVAGVPLLIGLFAGGHIKSFKGFGLELEAVLSTPIEGIELSATEKC